jgi:hypothetical protein
MLKRQVRRMLNDPRSAALIENFAGQWLYLRNLAVKGGAVEEFRHPGCLRQPVPPRFSD